MGSLQDHDALAHQHLAVEKIGQFLPRLSSADVGPNRNPSIGACRLAPRSDLTRPHFFAAAAVESLRRHSPE